MPISKIDAHEFEWINYKALQDILKKYLIIPLEVEVANKRVSI